MTKKPVEPTRITVADAIDAGKGEMECLKEEMESWRDNMEEKLSQTPKYEEVSEVCNILDTVVENLDCMCELDSDVGVEELSLVLSTKKKMSRNDRMSEAILYLDEAKSAIDSRIETLDEHIQEVEDTEGETSCPECGLDYDTTEEMVTHMKLDHDKTDLIVVYDEANDGADWVSKTEPDTDPTLRTKDAMVEEKEHLETLVEYLGEAIDEAQGVSFPGMY